MKKLMILLILMLSGCVEAKEEIVCVPTIEYIEIETIVTEYVEVENIIIETEYIEKLVKVPYEVIKEVIVEVPVEVIVYETITKTKWRTEYIEKIVEVETIIYVEKNRIGFLGDSITRGLNVPQIDATTVFKFNYSGNTTIDILALLDEVLSHDLDTIFLMTGISDARQSVDYATTLSNYNEIISRIKTESPKTMLYIQSILPVGEQEVLANNETILERNEYIANLAFTNSGVTYIDLHSLYADENGYMIEEYSTDGVHLTSLGYSVWIEELKKYGIE
jgi:lysophospholipase L1-like esterase